MREDRLEVTGGCHCGNLGFRLLASQPSEALPVRACGCRFCRQHAALSASDPAGHLSFNAHDPDLLSRYRFGLATADFLVCRACGVYVGALMPDGDGAFGLINIRASDEAHHFVQSPRDMDYGGEAEAARIYAEAFSKDPEFYKFWRTLQSYQKILDQKTTLVLSEDSELLKYLGE